MACGHRSSSLSMDVLCWPSLVAQSTCTLRPVLSESDSCSSRGRMDETSSVGPHSRDCTQRGESDTCTNYTPLYLNASSKQNIFYSVPHKKEIDSDTRTDLSCLGELSFLKQCPGITR